MKKKHWIPLLCSVVVVFFGALYIIVTFDSDKPISSLENTSKVESTPSPSSTVSSEKNFVMDGIGSFIYPYVYGVTLQKIDVNKPEIYSIKEGIKTVLVDGKKIICWYEQEKHNYDLSRDCTEIVVKGTAGEEQYETIFYYNSEKDIYRNLSSDVVKGYNYNYYKSISIDNYGVQWISNPKLSADNLLVAYSSNRRNYEAYANEMKKIPEERFLESEYYTPPYPDSDTWIINMATGEEYMAIENSSNLLGWVGRTLIYKIYTAGSGYSLGFMNIDTGANEIRRIPDFRFLNEIYFYNNSYFITGNDGSGNMYYYNLETDESYSYQIKKEGLEIIHYEFIQADDGTYYWAIYYKDTEKTDYPYKYYLGLLNIETGNENMYNFTEKFKPILSYEIKGIIGENKFVIIKRFTPNNTGECPQNINYAIVELEEYAGQGN